MDRRRFLKTSLAAGAGLALPSRRHVTRQEAVVMTVRGPVPPEALGPTLPHEHVLVDFGGAAVAGASRYDRAEVYRLVLPHLQQLVRLGGKTLVECTPAYLGRDPLLLKQLSEASGLHLVTNTGYYGARQDQHLPAHAFTDTADELAARWVRESQAGIDGSGVRPGFMKIGVDAGSLSDIDEKLVRAAARAHRKTGLPIAVHTGPAVAAFDQLAVLEEEAVAPSAWIWVHAQAEEDVSQHVRAARRGAWVEFDGLSPDGLEQHVALVLNMKQHQMLHRVLVSHDAGWYHVGEPGGGTFRPFGTLFEQFVPALLAAGLKEEEIELVTVTNPAAAFSIRSLR